jgi:predicted Na+-dependent transporter
MGNEFASIGSSLLLFFLVFGMSATVDIRHVRKQIRNRNALLTGISLQFIILPFLGFCVVKLMRMSAPMGITLLVVTSSPGGSYSNWYENDTVYIYTHNVVVVVVFVVV